MLFKGFWGELEKPIIGISPMDGVTDAAFRYMVCEASGRYGGKPAVVITEFTNVEGLARGASKMLTAFLYDEIERPIVAQIYGVEEESYYKCAVMLCAMGFDGIDINMGCPANKVARKGSGAALIKTPELAKKLVRVVKRAVRDWSEGITLEEAGVHPDIIAEAGVIGGCGTERRISGNGGRGTERRVGGNIGREVGRRVGGNGGREVERRMIPVSVKTRIGYDEEVAEEWVKHLLEEEPANITMHGRTLKQMYMGQASWEVLAKAGAICKKAGVSFLGNGDVSSLADARAKVEKYGVDGVLVGRALFGNPWFFSGHEPSVEERLAMVLEHCKYFDRLGHLAFHNIKKHLAWYCKGFEGARQMRMDLMQVENLEEVEKVVTSLT